MTRPSTPPILSELRSASSPASQVAALRALKNEVIGHEQKKEMWIGLGVLAPIARILNTHRGDGKRRHRDLNGTTILSRQKVARTDEEESRLQAVIILGSLAHGGPAYIQPIYASLIVSPLLSLLSPSESSPQIILAALRTLNAVANSLCLSHQDHVRSEDGLVALLYTEQYLSNIANLLLQASPSSVVEQQIALTATLIAKTCRDEHHRAMLAQTGILDALATRLASFVVASGCSVSHSKESSSGLRPSGDIPLANSRSKMAPILQAVGAIIQNSKVRATRFLTAPVFSLVLQKSDVDPASSSEKKGPAWGSNTSNVSNARQMPPNILENLLPPLPNFHFRSALAPTSNFPPLGSLGPSTKPALASRSFSSAVEVIQSQGLEFVEEEESLLVPWLLYIVRAESEVTALMAAWVLASFYREGLTRRGREATFALLLVPLLVRLLDKDLRLSPKVTNSYDNGAFLSCVNFIKEHTPSVLAMLSANSLEIQKAAAEAGAIKKLSQLLKESYDPVASKSSSPLWAPEPSTSGPLETQEDSSRLGAAGFSSTAHHIMRLRESVLVALAAIASDKDEYRRAIIDNGVVPFVIKTLKSEDTDDPSTSNNQSQSEGIARNQRMVTGNCKDAILAACGTARALSRSVVTLRTSLMDAGLTAPLFALLTNKDMQLKIEATAVVCNLVLEFSPMRDAIIEQGALNLLCEHAHSMNANLRLNSIWALKHLILGASNDVKRRCLKELGPGWLKQIVNYDVESSGLATVTKSGDREDGSATPIRMSTPNAAGEQVDLLNAVEEDSRESSHDIDEDAEEDWNMADSIGALSRADLSWKHHGFSSYHAHGHGSFSETAGTANRNTEPRPSNQGITDELAIQKEGLDFIRNLICGTGVSDMIDYIFQELGQEKLFELLAAKLRPRIFNAFNRERRSSESGVRHVQPPIDTVIAVCYIVVHIAAGFPRHRQLLISQTELLKLFVPLFKHPNREVRACCTWFVINLSWVDDQSDHANCKIRARELVNLGIFETLEAMENDPELDVRERARTARSQLTTLLRT